MITFTKLGSTSQHSLINKPPKAIEEFFRLNETRKVELSKKNYFLKLNQKELYYYFHQLIVISETKRNSQG